MKRMLALTITALLSLVAPRADAQPVDEPGISLSTPPALALTKAPPPPKSPWTALLLSAGSSAAMMLAGRALMETDDQGVSEAGAILGLTGLFITPNLGHFYSGEYGRALVHIGIRAALLGGGVAALVASGPCLFGCGDGGEFERPGLAVLGVVLLAGILPSAIYSIADSYKSAKRANERALRSLSAAPLVTRTADGSTAYGLALSGSF